MSHVKISNALSTHLQALPSAPPIAAENSGFTPKENQSYLAEHYMPAGTTGVGIAITDSLDYTGIYQIDVRTPLDEFKAEGNALADSVASHFKRGTVMTYETQDVVVQAVSRAQGRPDGAWWFIPVSVTWRAFGGNV